MTVFIDTAVVMYAGGADHPMREPCRAVIAHITAGRLPAATSAEVVQEILHRFTAIRQRELGATMARDTLDLFAPVLPITHAVMQRLPALVALYQGLSARDLVHVATCQQEGIRTIISPDRAFDAVGELTRVSPLDETAVRAHLSPA